MNWVVQPRQEFSPVAARAFAAANAAASLLACGPLTGNEPAILTKHVTETMPGQYRALFLGCRLQEVPRVLRQVRHLRHVAQWRSNLLPLTSHSLPQD